MGRSILIFTIFWNNYFFLKSTWSVFYSLFSIELFENLTTLLVTVINVVLKTPQCLKLRIWVLKHWLMEQDIHNVCKHFFYIRTQQIAAGKKRTEKIEFKVLFLLFGFLNHWAWSQHGSFRVRVIVFWLCFMSTELFIVQNKVHV